MNRKMKIPFQTVALVLMGAILLVGIQLFEEQLELIQYQENMIDKYKNEANLKDCEITDLKAVIDNLNNQIDSLTEELDGTRAALEEEKQKAKTTNVWNFSDYEIDLLYRLVESEAGGEPIEGRIAVTNVVLNRIKSSQFPNTLYDVINQKNQFEVVLNGMIDKKIPSDGTKEAVQRALNGEEVVPVGTVFFWSKYVDQNHPMWKHCPIVASIGVHNFAIEWR